MNILRILYILFLSVLVPALQLYAQYPERMSVSPRASDNYVIPPHNSSIAVNFDVRFSGEFPGGKYRYHYSVDSREVGTYTFPGKPFSTSFSAYLNYGWHSISVTLDRQVDASAWYDGVASGSTSASLDQEFEIVVRNSFEGVSEGQVRVDGQPRPSGYTFNAQRYSYHEFSDMENVNIHRNYQQHFDHWDGLPFSPDPSFSTGFYVDRDAIVTAVYYPVYNVYFLSNLPSGSVTVEWPKGLATCIYSFPAGPFPVAKGDGISASVSEHVVRGLLYAFSQWSDGSTSSTKTFTPGDHISYTASFVFSRPQAPADVRGEGSVGSHVQISWTPNPDNSVTYQVYRRTKSQPSQLVALVGSGGSSWTDHAYTVTGSGSDEMLFYYVYACYNGVLSDPSAAITCATRSGPDPRFADSNTLLNLNERPKEFAIGTFPNPFNPSTTISYQLAKDAFVKMEIYDIVGRLVRSLLNDSKSAGFYTVVWNGRDQMGKDVSSGVYLYRFGAMPLEGGSAYRHSGKLVLTR